ncbi:MAG: ATP-binding protein [Myxococcota bacterium]
MRSHLQARRPPVSPRVLIVEDEGIVAKDIEHTLKGLGYVVVGTAATEEDAVHKAEETNPDIVLMDIKLRDDGDGIRAAAEIRRRQDVPVVFLTAYADESTLQRAQTTGAFGYVLKPFEDRELHVAIVMAMCKHRAMDELEQRVADRTAALANAVRLRDEFMLVAAHELRTPLTGLLLNLESLVQSLSRGEERLVNRERALKKSVSAAAQARRLSILVERILDVTGLASEKLALQLGECDLGQMASEVVDGMREQARATGCELLLRVAGENTGTFDRARMQQVLTALIANALKYGAGKPVEVAVTGESDSIRLSVSDQGIGLRAEDAERIFGRFERVAARVNYAGLGIGLFVARRIVDAHHGHIEVQSAPDKGATFVVTLPREARDSAACSDREVAHGRP